ncbi:Mitochondrial-processing peptidase subunit alpha [Savitreella phatthalungensis]
MSRIAGKTVQRQLRRLASTVTNAEPSLAHGPSPAGRGQHSTVLTTLRNGVRVATDPTPGHFSAVGIFIEAGSRYEHSQALRGVSHIVDRLAFKSTKSRSQDDMITALESLGGTHMCSSSRESIMYTASVFNKDIEAVTELLADTVLNPLVLQDEVEAQLATAEYEIDEIWQKPEMILPELIHAAAYRDNTLGNSLLCPEDRLPHISADVVKAYRREFFRPERSVVAFVGVPHVQALEIADRLFAGWACQAEKALAGTARYTGGSIILPRDALSDPWTHLHIAYEAPSLKSPQIYSLATLQMLLGGGGSFSAGGPGKGMYSRLYTNVLNQYGWIESCQAFNHTYSDSGIFGIAASCRADAAYALSGVIARELSALVDTGTRGITLQEAQRAKNQLRSSLLMNLESKMVVLEDLGRQVQALGKRIAAEEMCHHIDSLTLHDLRATAEKVVMEGGRPAIVSAGPTADKIGDVHAVLERFGCA